ncbi:MAG: potassium transporter Kef [Micrococcales bacterium]|nr:MAG: potassium transporter Kef [Micrococcales bacterium]PIE26599.1 MAG: potassium transporter Kef [Micrococcales bacterium]
METVAAYLMVTFLAGMAAVLMRLPALIGFLAAGFILNAMAVEQLPLLDEAADLGVTLLLFGVGLKFDVRSLLAREVWLTASIHMIVFTVMAGGGLALIGLLSVGLLADLDLATCALLGFALSFSSTVFVLKTLEEHSDARSFYGRIAIGILIFQDIAAVAFLTVGKGSVPSPWALLLIALIPGAIVVRRIWDMVPHGEMQTVFGIMIALVPGYLAFESVHIKGDLGALAVGVLLAGHRSASELSQQLFSVKELLLVAFFLSIGFTGDPSWQAATLGLAALGLLPLKVVGFVWLLYWQKLRRRTAVLGGLVLGNYSEFGLIVVAIGAEAGMVDDQWLVAMSVAVAGSFVLSSVLNRANRYALNSARERMSPHPPDKVHPHERPIEVGDARAVVLGMGPVGRAAYRELRDGYGIPVLGVESDAARVQSLKQQLFHVVDADATDTDFWDRLQLTGRIEIAVLAMPLHATNLEVLRKLRDSDFNGVVATVVQYEDQQSEMHELGVDAAVQVYQGVGVTLAERAAEAVSERN